MRFLGLFGHLNIGELKTKGDIDELIKALNFPTDHNVRFEAAAALGDVGDSSCIEPLIAALDDNERVREVAIRSLGKIGDQQAIPPWLRLYKTKTGKSGAWLPDHLVRSGMNPPSKP